MNEERMVWERIFKFVPMVLIFLSLFLIVVSLGALKEYRYIGSGNQSNTITVSGEGEVFAIPDIAQFSFSVIEEAKDVETAQTTATEKADKAIEALKDKGVEEKDIKTTGYNVYPKYEYSRVICTEFSCPPSKQTLTGYEVNHSITVKVRKVDDAGSVIGALGSLNVSNISGISFTIDDEDEIQTEARQKAIDNAEEKAKELAKQLGVKLSKIVSFNENGNGGIYYKSAMPLGLGAGMGGDAMESAPSLPAGENRVVSNVSITYEIR